MDCDDEIPSDMESLGLRLSPSPSRTPVDELLAEDEGIADEENSDRGDSQSVSPPSPTDANTATFPRVPNIDPLESNIPSQREKAPNRTNSSNHNAMATSESSESGYDAVWTCYLCDAQESSQAVMEAHLTGVHAVTNVEFLPNLYQVTRWRLEAVLQADSEPNLTPAPTPPAMVSRIVNGGISDHTYSARSSNNVPPLLSLFATATGDPPVFFPMFLSSRSRNLLRQCSRYRCRLCGVVMHRSKSMKSHLASEHPGDDHEQSKLRQKLKVVLNRGDVEAALRLQSPSASAFNDEDEPMELNSDWTIEHVPEVRIAGELVWAKMGTYPWWPGVILPEPRTTQHFKEHQGSMEYHVVFLDKGTTMSRGWIKESLVVSFENSDQKKLPSKSKFRKRLKEGLSWAEWTQDMSVSERRHYFMEKT